MAAEPTPDIEDDELTVRELILGLRYWVNYLWSKRYILMIAGILGGVAGLGVALWKKPSYKATTTFVLEGNDGRGGLSQYAGVAALAGIDLAGGGGGLFQGDNILELYKSRKMLMQTLLSKVYPDSNELLIERYLAFTGGKENWNERIELSSLDFHVNPSQLSPRGQRARDSVITKIAKEINEKILTVDKLNKKLSIIQVDVNSPDEVFSKVFNENLVQHVNEFYIQTRTKRSSENIRILESKVDSVLAVMEGAIYSAAMASDATPNLNPARQVQRIAPVQEAQFSAEANKAILSQLLQNLELAKINLLQEQPLIQLVDHPIYPLKVKQLGIVGGVILGGLLVGFLTVVYLVLKRVYSRIMQEENESL